MRAEDFGLRTIGQWGLTSKLKKSGLESGRGAEMSGRMLRKALKEQEKLTATSQSQSNDDDHDADSNDPTEPAHPPVNRFDLLDTQVEEDTCELSDVDSNQDDSKPGSVGEENSHVSTSVKSKNKKKKKKKNKAKISSFEPIKDTSADLLLERLNVTGTECASDRDSLDAHSGKTALRTNSGLGGKYISAKCTSQILSVDPKFLRAEDELRRIFGSKVINACENSSHSDNQRRKQGLRRGARSFHTRKTTLVVPSDYWPRWDGSLSMELVETKEGLQFFRYTHPSSYLEAQRKFEAAKNMYDLNGIAFVLAQHPYHVESLLALAEAFKYAGDHQRSVEAIEKCLYALECAWHPLFNPVRGNCRLDYSCDANKPLFSALRRHMQNLDRRGCSRSALEVCKMILSLDSDNPDGALFCIDYFSLRSQQYEWLELFADQYGSDNSLWLLPNFSFSLAIARFYLERDTSIKQTPQTDTVSSSELLKQALMLHPLALKKIVDRAPLKDAAWTQILKHPHFAYAEAGSPSLEHLTEIYVERSYLIWRLPELQKWLIDAALQVIQIVNQDEGEAKDWACVRKEAFASDRNEYTHLSIADFSDSVPTIPPEEMRHMMVDRPGIDVDPDALAGQHHQQGHPGNLENGNPVLMFLQSLLPWMDYGPNANNDEQREGENPGEEN